MAVVRDTDLQPVVLLALAGTDQHEAPILAGRMPVDREAVNVARA